jgi:hypothetical protein
MGGGYGYYATEVEGCVGKIPKQVWTGEYSNNPGWEILDENATYYFESVDGYVKSVPGVKVRKPPEDCFFKPSEQEQRTNNAVIGGGIAYIAVLGALILRDTYLGLKSRYTVSEGKTETGDKGE